MRKVLAMLAVVVGGALGLALTSKAAPKDPPPQQVTIAQVVEVGPGGWNIRGTYIGFSAVPSVTTGVQPSGASEDNRAATTEFPTSGRYHSVHSLSPAGNGTVYIDVSATNGCECASDTYTATSAWWYDPLLGEGDAQFYYTLDPEDNLISSVYWDSYSDGLERNYVTITVKLSQNTAAFFGSADMEARLASTPSVSVATTDTIYKLNTTTRILTITSRVTATSTSGAIQVRAKANAGDILPGNPPIPIDYTAYSVWLTVNPNSFGAVPE